MIHHHEILGVFKDIPLRDRGAPPFDQARRLSAGMREEAVIPGVLPPRDRFDGSDLDIRIAAVLPRRFDDTFAPEGAVPEATAIPTVSSGSDVTRLSCDRKA